MKKLIAIAVVFVLAVGAAFAADLSAEVIGRADVLQGSSEDGDPVKAAWGGGRIRVAASGQNDDGNFGGWIRYQSTIQSDPQLHGYAWWKPLDIFKLTLGVNPDGFFSADGVARWGFYQVACDVGVPKENWSSQRGFSGPFYGGFGSTGMVLTLTPIEPLEINVAIPYPDDAAEAKDVYKLLQGQIAYNISSIGKVALTYVGSLDKQQTYNEWEPLNSKLFGFFQLMAIENLEIDLGVGFILPVKYDDDSRPGRASETTFNSPVAVGLAVNFTTGPLGIKARVQGQFGEKWVRGNVTEKGTSFIAADLLPSFGVTDTVTALLDTGLTMTSSEGSDTIVGWHIMPYVTVKANWWAPNFYAGFRFESDGGPAKVTNWSIPVGIAFAF